ncbi:hypothetical protein G8759_32880 [Spirosoma aureum]|uniref:PKD domain-containing protein n=1 Tax=Spirosoma aureum TaxID=2692134 RepID=A0A6G9AY28_9BACT|nr:DUF11 domain-containing protein [Spirosoma aureum]QIP17093.1 hypothetical protein G8759_32880 [Spirosoma aureum]
MRYIYVLLAVSTTAFSSLFAQSYPTTFYLSSNSPVCDGQSFRVSAAYSVPPAGTTVSFRWAGPNNFTSAAYGAINVPASAATTGVYSVTMTFSGTNQGTATASTTVGLGTSKPMALVYDGPYTYSGRSICGPTSLSLVAHPDELYSSNTASYHWTGPNGFESTERNPLVEQGVAGLYILEATYPGNCGIGKDTVRIYNTTLSVGVSSYSTGANPQYSSSSTFCPGSSLELRATTSLPIGTTATYQWSGPNGFTSAAQSFTLTNATAAMAGVYSVTATYSGNCAGTATASQTITIGAPSLFAFSSDVASTGERSVNTFCPGSNFRIVAASSGVAPTNYQWSGPNGFTSTASSTTLTNATATMSGIYSVTATFSEGCSSTATAQVTIGQPSLSIGSFLVDNNFYSSTFCPGSSFRVAVSTNSTISATYQWSGPNGFTSSAQSFTLTNATAAMAGVYSVTAIYSGSCAGTATASQTITIGAPYVSAFSSETSIINGGSSVNTFCPGSSFRVAVSTGGSGTTYQWRGPNGFVNTAQSFTLTNATAAMSGAYSVTATFAEGCSNTATAQVTIGQPTVYIGSYSAETNSYNTTFCPGSNVRLAAFPSASTALATYQWSGPNGFTSTAQSFTLTNGSAANAGIYSVTATFSGSCSNTATASQTITIREPFASAFSSDVNSYGGNSVNTFCPSSSFRIAATLSSNSVSTSYQWSGPDGFSSSASSTTLTNATAAMAGVYSVTATYSGSCAGTATASLTITIGTPYVFAFSLDSTNMNGGYIYTFCPGSSFRISAASSSSSAPVTYQWSGPNGFTSTASSTTLSNATAAMSGTYSVTATFSGGCSNTATARVTIGLPTVSVGSYWVDNNSYSTTFCPGSNVRLAAASSSSSALATYQWSGPNGFTSTAQSFTLTNATAANAGIYSVTATFSGSCSNTAIASQTIQIGQPSLNISSNPYACPGGQLSLNAWPFVGYSTYNAPATYQWRGPNGFTSSTQNFTLTNVTPAMAGTYSVTATLSGACAGVVTTSTEVQVKKPLVDIHSRLTGGASIGERYCPGTSFDLTAIFVYTAADSLSSRSALTYQWSGPNGFSSSVKQPTILSANSLASGIYSVTVTVAGECSGNYTATQQINVGKPISYASAYPLVGIAQSDTYCPGATVVLSASSRPNNAPVESYQWRGPNGYTSSAKSLTFVNISPAMAGIYSLTTVYSGQCASTRVSFANVIVDTPDIRIGVYRPNGGGGDTPSLCFGNTYRLSPNAFSYNYNDIFTDNAFEWTLPDGSISTSPSLTIASASSANAGRYILKTTLGGVCASATTQDTVDLVVGVPRPQVRASNPFIANGRSTTLLAEKCLGSNVLWSDGQTGRSIVVSPTQTMTYTATCFNLEDCLGTPSDPLTVRVSDQPEADLSLNLSVSSRIPAVGQPVTVTLSITNSSAQEAHNVQVESRLPDLLTIVHAGDLQINGAVLSATIPSISANGAVNLTVQVAATSVGGIRLAAQVMASDNPDPDSYPGSGTNDGQDDAGWVDLRTGMPGSIVSVSPEPNPAHLPAPNITPVFLPEGLVDLSLNASVNNAAPALNETITVTLLVNNDNNRRLLSPEVTCQLPAGLTFIGGTHLVATGQQVTLTGGRFYPEWPQKFSFQVQVTGPVTEPIKARISYCDWDDVDSDPANNFDTGEDDTVQVSLRVK